MSEGRENRQNELKRKKIMGESEAESTGFDTT